MFSQNAVDGSGSSTRFCWITADDIPKSLKMEANPKKNAHIPTRP